MGFNISGLVIDKNYKDEFDSLQSEFGWNLKKEADIDFETAFSNWKDFSIFRVITNVHNLYFINLKNRFFDKIKYEKYYSGL